MTRIDFYILPDADETRRQIFLCRLIDKAWRLGNRIRIHAPEAGHRARLDELLWTFDPGSFLPHERDDGNDHDADCPIVIGDATNTDNRELLVNEGPDVPASFATYPRIAEVVNQEATVRSAGRSRYAYYREQGCDLHHHTMEAG